MIKIVCIGDNVVDINYTDGVIHPGGNCVNVAVYCSQLGYCASYIGTLADDANAKVITDSLDAYGVDYHLSPVMHGETGRCTCRLVNGERVLGDENDGGLVKSNPIQISRTILDGIKEYDLIHTSCYSYIDNQLSTLHSTGIPILYDFSTEWTKERVKFIGEDIDYFLFSERKDLTKEENDEILYESVDKYGADISILTRGTKGAFVYDGTDVYFKEPYNVSAGAIDTTGCGDSWISGFITTYIDQMKRLDIMIKNSDRDFLSNSDVLDFKRESIKLGMCVGNAKARYTSRVKGAYNWGIEIAKKEN